MSRSARAAEFLKQWRDGHGAEHTEHGWGRDDCLRCIADLYDPWEAFVHAAQIMGIEGYRAEPNSVVMGGEHACATCGGSGRCSDMTCWCLTDRCHVCGGTGRLATPNPVSGG